MRRSEIVDYAEGVIYRQMVKAGFRFVRGSAPTRTFGVTLKLPLEPEGEVVMKTDGDFFVFEQQHD